MTIGMIDLGRMGTDMVRRLMRAGHQSVVFDRLAVVVGALVKEGATEAGSLDDPRTTHTISTPARSQRYGAAAVSLRPGSSSRTPLRLRGRSLDSIPCESSASFATARRMGALPIAIPGALTSG